MTIVCDRETDISDRRSCVHLDLELAFADEHLPLRSTHRPAATIPRT